MRLFVCIKRDSKKENEKKKRTPGISFGNTREGVGIVAFFPLKAILSLCFV